MFTWPGMGHTSPWPDVSLQTCTPALKQPQQLDSPLLDPAPTSPPTLQASELGLSSLNTDSALGVGATRDQGRSCGRGTVEPA